MRNPKLRFHLALAFLVWSLVPHFKLVVHAHAGAEGGHAHATLSAGELQLADQALQALPSADPREFGGESTDPPLSRSGEPAWGPCDGPESHAHLQPDLNSVPGPVLAGGPASRAPPDAVPDLRYRAPAPSAPADRPARGPPAAFLA